jgi:hypothetical protein
MYLMAREGVIKLKGDLTFRPENDINRSFTFTQLPVACDDKIQNFHDGRDIVKTVRFLCHLKFTASVANCNQRLDYEIYSYA